MEPDEGRGVTWQDGPEPAVAEAAGAKIRKGADPVLLPKAQKNEAEIAGVRAAHIRDGAALTRFLKWVTEEGAAGRRPRRAGDADALLRSCRRRDGIF